MDVVYVTMVVHVCCKRLFPMFHLFFQTYVCKCVYLDVAYVSHICCMRFICMWRMVAMAFKCVLGVFFKCFNCLQTYVATVVFGYFKSKSGVASLLFPPSATSSLPEPAGHPYE